MTKIYDPRGFENEAILRVNKLIQSYLPEMGIIKVYTVDRRSIKSSMVVGHFIVVIHKNIESGNAHRHEHISFKDVKAKKLSSLKSVFRKTTGREYAPDSPMYNEFLRLLDQHIINAEKHFKIVLIDIEPDIESDVESDIEPDIESVPLEVEECEVEDNDAIAGIEESEIKRDKSVPLDMSYIFVTVADGWAYQGYTYPDKWVPGKPIKLLCPRLVPNPFNNQYVGNFTPVKLRNVTIVNPITVNVGNSAVITQIIDEKIKSLNSTKRP